MPKKSRQDSLVRKKRTGIDPNIRASKQVKTKTRPTKKPDFAAAEERLRENEALLNSFFDSPGVMQGIVEVIDDVDIKHVRDNVVTARYVGLTPADLQGKLSSELGEPAERIEVWLKHYKQSQLSGQPVNFEYLDRQGSNESWLAVTVVFLGTAPDGHPRFAYIVTDVTDRKKTEEALRKAQNELEMRIEKCTKELTETSKQLQTEIVVRRRAEEALRAERKRFLDVLEMLPAYLILLTPDYHVSYANRFFRERFGKDIGDKRCFEYLFGRTEPCDICETYKVLKTMSSLEWEWTGPDGRNYHIFDSPFVDVDGSTRIMEVGIDITESKKAEKKLREASLYARSLIEASLDPLVTISAEGKITDVSKATEEATGFNREQLIGSDFSNYFTEPEKARAGYQEVFNKGFVRDYPLAIRHKSGRILDVLYNATLYRNEAGEIQGVFADARDVTERKLAGEKVRAAYLYSRSLIEASLDPLVTINAEGKITDVNKATELATGCSREELVGSDFSIYFTDSERAAAGYKQVFIDGFVTDYQLAIKHKSGRVTEVVYNAAVYRNEEGKVQGVFAAARDITERRKLETKLQESERLAAIGATAGMVGHDIRNPLQSIEGAVYLAKEELKPYPENPKKKELLEVLEIIEAQTRYIDHIVADLQDFARTLVPQPKETNIQEVMDDALSSLQIPKDIEIHTSFQRDLEKPIVDQTFLKRVFVNLIENAVQAMPNGGILTVKIFTDNEALHVSIEDTGTGIAEEYKKKMFTPLFTTKAKGQGFGLAVCKKLVEVHKGEITFESEVGKGTKFKIRLPLRETKN